MARLIDIEDNPVEDLNPVADEPTTEEQPEPEVEAQDNQVAPDEDDDIPEKYRGKDAKELIRMHQEAEKAYGRKGSEVGELRKLVDEYIVNQTVETTPPPKVEDETDIFTDPDGYFDSKLANHPDIVALKQDRTQAKLDANKAQMAAKHPDYMEIMQDNAFAKWIGDSKTRTRLFIEADQGYDADAADELLTNWKERKAMSQQTVEADKEVRKADIKNASTGGATGASVKQGKPVYRRTDIMNLMNSDPEKYQQRASEFLLAYKEKRVI